MQVLSAGCRQEAPADMMVDVSTLEAAAATAAARIRAHGAVLLKIGALRLDGPQSLKVATTFLGVLRCELAATGGLGGLKLEIDEVDGTMVPDGAFTRDRVPHNDSQKTTFLTPSVLDVPDFDPAWRQLTGRLLGAHKPYAGIFIQDPGDGLSITTFYDGLAMVRDAFAHQVGRPPGGLTELATWQGQCVFRARQRQPQHGLPYITLGGLLSPEPDVAWEAVSYCTTACSVEDAALRTFPVLNELRCTCPCGACSGEAERFVCRMTERALGLTWPQTRAKYERCLNSERFDLIVWNNVAMLHGAVAGASNRLLRPIYLTLPEATGDDYEHWLSQQWRTHPALIADRRETAA